MYKIMARNILKDVDIQEEELSEGPELEFDDDDLDEEDKKEQEKQERIAKERKELLNKVTSGNIKSHRERVAYILNNYSESRNSDVELTWTYWKIFEGRFFDGVSVNKNQLQKLTRMNSLVRIRAKIQNEYLLFQADETVRHYRGVLNREKKAEVVEDKPANLPFYGVFIDETGKTQKYLSVGSLWHIDGGLSTYSTKEKLDEWKNEQSIEYEFHFNQVSRNKLQAYKDFFLKFLELNPTAGFKIIIINNKGFQDISQTITDLTFHLLNRGIKHENESGRAPLPRLLQVWLDEDEKGSDRLKLENIRERLTSQKISGLHLGMFEALDSKSNYYIQAVDLFTAAVNRKLHSGGANNFKDDLADFILELLQFDVSKIDRANSEVDKSTVFNLSYQD
jgi:hypothetical protein